MSRVIISDPHGCIKTLKALIAQLPSGVPITLAGDLMDRGSDSRGVIELVKNGGYDCVMGNHEILMINDLKFRTKEDGTEQHYVDYYHSAWISNGGDKCLSSYIINGAMDIETLKEHVEWLKTLPYYLEYPELKDDKGQHLLVTHTTASEVWGIASPESQAFKESVTWERINYPSKIDDIYNIYGHTPQQYKATIKEHFACIDTGAYFKRKPYGRMTALQFPEMIVFTQENIED